MTNVRESVTEYLGSRLNGLRSGVASRYRLGPEYPNFNRYARTDEFLEQAGVVDRSYNSSRNGRIISVTNHVKADGTPQVDCAFDDVVQDVLRKRQVRIRADRPEDSLIHDVLVDAGLLRKETDTNRRSGNILVNVYSLTDLGRLYETAS
ncbi:MAG: hypothetical protein HYT71_00730 [Candidatus Aenigmarchaeota archaeon]|nr:hypothetical protein [Candidatus Aenigmarchaeota archaeon]